MRNDVRYREVKRRVKEKNHKKNYQLKLLGQTTIFDLDEFEYQSEYYFENYQRAEPVFDPGGFTVEARKILLEYLLYIQEKAGELLIEENEIKAIIKAWEETDGIVYRYEDIQPREFHFDGTIAFDAEGKIKKTDNPNPIFFVDIEMNMEEDELIYYLKKRQKEAYKFVWDWLGWTKNSNEETQNISLRYLFTSAIGDALNKKYEMKQSLEKVQ